MRNSTLVLAITAVAACGGSARLPVTAGMGPNPVLPPPRTSLIPVVKVATAVGWPAGVTPTAAEGTSVVAFATDLSHPRSLYVLPNGDVLVAETNAPQRPEDAPRGIRGWFMKRYFKRAGAAVPSANRITLLRDADGDGIAETRSILLRDLQSPFGMALIGNELYVANSDSLVKFPYRTGQMTITASGVKVTDLAGGALNHHWTKSLIASADGSKLFATAGSNSNVAEHGIEREAERAAIWEVDPRTGSHRVFASGLRNPVGLAWEAETGVLWTSVNERDELGSDLVPDYITAVRDGGFYGWPYSYYGQLVDARVKPQRPDLVATAIVPDYALGPHTGSLGLTSSRGTTLPAANGKPTGALPIEVLTAFLDSEGRARGRPVGLAIDKRGALLVADDVGNVVWRVTGTSVAVK
jgi:glucose/arabinose dehydrogenase